MTQVNLKVADVSAVKTVTLDVSGANRLKNSRKVWKQPDTIEVVFNNKKLRSVTVYDNEANIVRRYAGVDIKFGYYLPQWITDAIKKAQATTKVGA